MSCFFDLTLFSSNGCALRCSLLAALRRLRVVRVRFLGASPFAAVRFRPAPFFAGRRTGRFFWSPCSQQIQRSYVPQTPISVCQTLYRFSHRRHHGNEYGAHPQIVWKDRGVDSFPLVLQRVLRRGRVPQLRNAYLHKTDIVVGVPQSQNGFKSVDRLPLHSA